MGSLASDGLRKMAAELRDDFYSISYALDKHAKNVNKARVVGGSVGLVGSIVAIVGAALLIPATMGASAIGLVIGGGIVGAVGGMTAGGAQVTKIIIEKIKEKRVDHKWSVFADMMTEELQNDPETFKRLHDNLPVNLAQLGFAGINITQNIAGAAVRGATAGAEVGGTTAARVIAVAAAGSIALNAVLLGFSAYDVIDGARQLAKDTGSEAGNRLREIADDLDMFAQIRQWPQETFAFFDFDSSMESIE